MTIKMKPPAEKTVRKLLNRYACPVPYHEVRTRFLGNIASPDLMASPGAVVEGLWGGELPVFDSMEDAKELIGVLVQGLWNELSKHQKPSKRFRLTRLDLEPSVTSLARFSTVRRQEIEGFLIGLFNGADTIDVPERAFRTLDHLEQLRAMMAGIQELIGHDGLEECGSELGAIFKNLHQITKIMEIEIHEAVLACIEARGQMLTGLQFPRSSVH